MHVDIITDNRWVYTFETHAAAKVKEQFDKMGISYRHLVIADGNLFSTMISKLPDAILCFQNPGELRKPIGEYFRCPTFHWETRELGHAWSALDSGYAKVGFYDPTLQHANLIFLPHAASTDLPQAKKRSFDVITFANIIDQNNQQESWKFYFNEEERAAIIDESLACPESLFRGDLMLWREQYQKAQVAWEMVHQTTLPLHVFGEHIGRHLLKRVPLNVHLHGDLSYLASLNALSQSKVLVSHQMHGGFDRWFLPALFSGCLVITNETPYLRKIIGNQFDIFYPYQNWKVMDERVQYYLKNPKIRAEMVKALQEKLGPEHNWEVRTKQLVTHLKKDES